MRVEVRANSIIIDGYVNAVERVSKPIPSNRGKFIEKISAGAFKRSLEKRENVDLLLNHDENRKLGSTSEGTLELFEDNIGLRAICTIKDKDVIEKAKRNELRGWSFGFYAESDEWQDIEGGYSVRTVKELDLFEVSIIDNTRNPAYTATSIEMRDDKEVLVETRTQEAKTVTSIEENNNPSKRDIDIDYSKYIQEIENLKESSGRYE